MAHETLVHRWDAEAGAGTTGAAMDPTVAPTGSTSILDVFVAVTRGLQSSPAGPSFHYECTDTGDSWFLQLPSAGTRVITREPVECAVRFRGPAEGLLLVAWGRLRPDLAGVEVLGDTGVLSRLNELLPPLMSTRRCACTLGMDRGSVGRNARWQTQSSSARSTAKRASATRAAA